MRALQVGAVALAIVTATLVLGMFAAFTLGVWTGDDRWVSTGIRLMFAPIFTGGAAAFLFVGAES